MRGRREGLDEDKQFIAGYIDEDFFDSGYRLKATESIDKRIDELNAMIPDYLDKKLDTKDLDEERTRLLDLRHGLGEILSRLRSTLCLDIRDVEFDASVERLVKAIHSPRSL